jgi:hypothetical protein
MMKIKVLGFALILTGLLGSRCFATFSILRDASTISRGTLSNDRLDISGLRTTINSGLTPASYSIVVGTSGVQGVDIATNNLRAALETINMMVNGSVNATGVNPSVGNGASVLFLPGTYVNDAMGSTIPAGVSVYALDKSSTIWKLGNSTISLFTCYGDGSSEINGITFSFDNLAFSNPGIMVKDGCKIKNSRVVDAASMANTGGAGIFVIQNSSNAYVESDIKSWKGNSALYSRPFRFREARNSVFKLNITGNTSATNSGAFEILNSSDCYIQDGYWEQMGGSFIRLLGGNRRIFILNNTMNATSANDGSGYIWTSGETADNFVSSGIVIANNRLIYKTNSANCNWFILNIYDNYGVVLRDNYISATTNVTATVFTIGAISVKALLMGNIIQNANGSALTYLSDSGTDTQSTGNNNRLDGVAK